MKVMMDYVQFSKKSRNSGVPSNWLGRFLKFSFILLTMTIGLLAVPLSAAADDLLNGGSVSGLINPAGYVASYTFTANEGESVQIRMVDTSITGDLNPHLRLLSPSGEEIVFGTPLVHWDPVAIMSYTAEETGIYTVLASDFIGTNTGRYNIYFAHMPGANEHGTLINDGLHQEQIDLGDLDTYTFTVNADETVQIRIADTSITGDLHPSLRLYGPSGGEIVFGTPLVHSDTVAIMSYKASETGTYTLLVSDFRYKFTGSYNIYFAHFPEANEHGALINDGLHQERIDLGDLDTYTFSVNADDTVKIQMVDTSITGDLHPSLRLYDPTGEEIVFGTPVVSWDPVAIMSYTATETGTYTLLASDFRYDNTGSYNIYYARMPGANEHGLLYNDNTLSETIDLGDLDTYTFIADVGETFEIDVADMSASGDLRPHIELYGPSGGNHIKVNAGDEVATFSHTVTEIGTYTVLVKDGSTGARATGEYEINCTTDGDNDIDGEDLNAFAVDYDNMTFPYADKDGNGTIDEDDVARFALVYGKQ